MSLKNRGSIEPYMPDSIDYYEHQVEGVRRMCGMRSFLLADEMGLGKSLQTLTVFAVDVWMGNSKSAIIVVPASLKRNWYEEIGKFTTFYRHILAGTPTERSKQITEFRHRLGPKILIVNYEQVYRHLGEINQCGFDVVMFDEAHYLKNPKAKRTKACLNIFARRSFLITGSPLLNHVNELWALLERIQPNNWGTYHQFVNKYCVFGGFKDKQIVGVKNEKKLTTELQNVMIRRLKKDVLDLPEVQYIDRVVELDPQQRKYYDEILKELKLTVPGQEEVKIVNPLVKMLRLKQICGTLSTVIPGLDISPKLDLAVQDLIPILESGQKVVVFTQSLEVQRCYANRVNNVRHTTGPKKGKPKYPVYLLNGSISSDRRQELAHIWGKNPEAGVIICMYQVAGVGLNLVEASICQRIDRLFVPELNNQAVSRLDRIGQLGGMNGTVQVLDYHVNNTAEQRVEKILLGKKKVFANIVERDNWTSTVINQTIAEEIARANTQRKAAA